MTTEAVDRDDDDDTERRWAAIRSKLEASSEQLIGRGALVAKVACGRRIWVVRFGDESGPRKVLRTVYVGDDPELVDRARRLLASYKGRARWPAEVAASARLAARAVGTMRR